ncbi:MAG: ATP-binding cassette domain-containing protein [Ignavibacteria bacterium]|nr:ATP-binding cassette domain-containing protein [Ignavibacteria bacterium]
MGRSGSGKSTMMHLLLGLLKPTSGIVEAFQVSLQQANLNSLRIHVGYMHPESQLISGSILDNITFGREIDRNSLRWAIELTGCTEEIDNLPGGIMYRITGSEEDLAYGLRKKIIITRCIVNKPQILILDEAFEGIEDSLKLSMIDRIFKEKDWTVINVSHDPELVAKTEFTYVLDSGKIVESGIPLELSRKADSVFRTLFPNSNFFETNAR